MACFQETAKAVTVNRAAGRCLQVFVRKAYVLATRWDHRPLIREGMRTDGEVAGPFGFFGSPQTALNRGLPFAVHAPRPAVRPANVFRSRRCRAVGIRFPCSRFGRTRMTESISLGVHLEAFVRRETARRWVATCPMVGVVSQGKTSDDAKRCLQEAIELWFESCVERGVLDQALREANFRPTPADHSAGGTERVTRRRKARSDSVLGEPFEIHLTIPAYEAATLLTATA